MQTYCTNQNFYISANGANGSLPPSAGMLRRQVRRGESGHYYCGRKGLYKCPYGCDGQCGPSSGCNCPDCRLLERASLFPWVHERVSSSLIKPHHPECKCNGVGLYKHGTTIACCDGCREQAYYHACPNHDLCKSCWTNSALAARLFQDVRLVWVRVPAPLSNRTAAIQRDQPECPCDGKGFYRNGIGVCDVCRGTPALHACPNLDLCAGCYRSPFGFSVRSKSSNWKPIPVPAPPPPRIVPINPFKSLDDDDEDDDIGGFLAHFLKRGAVLDAFPASPLRGRRPTGTALVSRVKAITSSEDFFATIRSGLVRFCFLFLSF